MIEQSDNGWECFKKFGKDWEWLKTVENNGWVENGWKQLKMLQNGWK